MTFVVQFKVTIGISIESRGIEITCRNETKAKPRFVFRCYCKTRNNKLETGNIISLLIEKNSDKNQK